MAGDTRRLGDLGALGSRVIRSATGLVAVAALIGSAATSASAAGQRPATIAQTWFTNAASLPPLIQGSATLAVEFFDRPESYEWLGSVPDGWTTTAYWNYRSYAQFNSDLANGVAPDVPLLFYDPEKWTPTPIGEQRHPFRFMSKFATLAHANGYQVVISPALGLLSVGGGDCTQMSGESAFDAYIRCGFPAAAAGPADGFEVQVQGDECGLSLQAYVSIYQDEVTRAAEQARQANPAVAVYSGLTTGKCTPPGDVLYAAWTAVQPIVDGHFIAATYTNQNAAIDLFGLISPFVVGSAGFVDPAVVSGQGVTTAWMVDPAAIGTHTITDASGMGLFTSGPLAPGSLYRFRFVGAGVYPVADTSTGHLCTITIPLRLSPLSGGVADVFTVRTAAEGAPPNHVFETQTQRPGSTSFVLWKTGPLNTFVPDAGPGVYTFRAHLKNKLNGASSGWSSLVSITVS